MLTRAPRRSIHWFRVFDRALRVAACPALAAPLTLADTAPGDCVALRAREGAAVKAYLKALPAR